MSGWICSYRKIWDNPLFKGRGDRVAVWHWVLHNAAWKDTHQDVHGAKVLVKRGQVLTTYSQIETQTGIGRQVTRTLFAHLSGQHGGQPAINIQTNTGRLLITICNYNTYQSRETTTNTAPNQSLTSSQHVKEQDKQINNPSNEGDAAAPPHDPVEVSVLSKAVWDSGKPFLASRGVKNPGALIGRWLKSHSPVQVLEALAEAQKAGTQDPIPYITETLKGDRNDRTRNHPQQRVDPALEQIARLTGIAAAPGHGGG